MNEGKFLGETKILERLIASETIEDSYERWTDYRYQLTSLIEGLKEKTTDRLVLLGAGRCSDLDLKRLSKVYQEIILVDRDLEAMEEAIKRYDTPMVKTYSLDFFKVTTKEYDELIKNLQEKNFSLVKEQLSNMKDVPKNNPLPADIEGEVVVAVGLHSQLISRLVALFSLYQEQFSYEERQEIQNIFSKLTTVAVSELHNWVTNQIGGFRTFLIGYEYAAFVGEQRAFMDKILEDYLQGVVHDLSRYGIFRVQGGVQAEEDIRKRVEKKQLFLRQWGMFSWEFLKEKQYLVTIMVLST
ncbi:MAG: hypothetical protein U0L23_05940 [Lachnospiraceae bacterium]|nr:hypothetical protein [Lachnospiraceae bacterium]